MSELNQLRREREAEELKVLLDELANSEDWQVRLASVTRILGCRRTKEFYQDVIPALIASLDDPEPLVRQAVIPALGDIGSGAKDAIDPLLAYIKKASNTEIKNVVYSLGKIGPESARGSKILIELFKAGDPQLEKAISWALSIIGPDVLEDLKQGAASHDIAVKKGCIQAIGNMGPVAASGIPLLILSLKDPVTEVRLEAARALGNLRAAPEVIDSIPALKEVLTDEDPDVRWLAAEALRKIGTPEALSAWENFESIDTVDARIKQLVNEDKGVRLAAAEALYGILEENSAVDFAILKRALNDTYQKVPLALCLALPKLKEAAAPVVPELIELSKSSDINTRVATITCLGKIGTLAEEDLAQLIKYLEDKEKEVRMAAGLALELIGSPQAEKALKKFKWQ